MPGRLVEHDGVLASSGLAGDEALVRSAGRGEGSPTLRLYTYRPCVLVGRFQTVEHEVDVEHCRARRMDVNRRPTGGGAIVMGPDQLGVALALGPGDALAGVPARECPTREYMARFAEGIIGALDSLGIRAVFRGKNDIEVDGRKIAGLGMYRPPGGGVLLHGSVLVDLDVAEMLRLLRTPFEKLSDKAIATVGARTTTVRDRLAAPVALADVRAAVARGCAAVLRLELVPGDLSPAERDDLRELERSKYATREWVHQPNRVPDRIGAARLKTPLGLLDLRVTLAGNTIKAAFIGGDFMASDNAIAALESSLRWHSASPGAVRETLAGVYRRRGPELDGFPVQALAEVIGEAVAAARRVGESAADPYGCFVSPGGVRA